MKRYTSLLLIIILIGNLAACTTKSTSPTNREVALRESEQQVFDTELQIDTLKNGPFYKQVSCFKNDDNGGYEEYRLTMNLYKEDIPNGKNAPCYGTLVLYVKTPDNTEGIEVSRRIIDQVLQLEDNIAQLNMSSSEERPQTFNATIIYNQEDYTYSLQMSAPNSLEDLMENHIRLQ